MRGRAVIVIPVYKNSLRDLEMIGLRQCFKVLSHYNIVFIGPESFDPDDDYKSFINKAQYRSLDDDHFQSIESYNQLLLSAWFYELFSDYEYMLIHQLDAFVFDDRLKEWMDKGYSYVGAPWFKKNEAGEYVKEFLEVGNGGFSLRKIKDCIKVLKSDKKVFSLKQNISIQKDYGNRNFLWHGFNDHLKGVRFNELSDAKDVNEDKILVKAADRFDFFKVPEPEEALDFSFERFPEHLFEMNSEKLPFGCHAWWTYDINFYRPIFAEMGYQI